MHAPCPSEDEISAWLDGGLAAGAIAPLERHLDQCARCRTLLAAAAGATTNAAVPQASTPVEQAPRASSWSAPEQIDEYRYLRPIGQGGMGHVHLYQDTLLQRPVAVKFLHHLGAQQRERFRREAVAIARLSHPNIVAVYRAGESAGTPYLVSEYVEGEPLDRLRLPLPPEQVLDLARQLAAGLDHAHGCGVLHRDIKPANVLRTKDGRVKLVDFGLAKLVGEPAEVADGVPPGSAADAVEPPVRTADGQRLGTPLYMSPEQWRGEPATERSDLYALGATLYHVASGRPPFDAGGASLAHLGFLIVTTDPTPLSEAAPGLPGWFREILQRCLDRDAARRPASAQALLARLEGPPPSARRWRRALALALLGLCGAAAVAAVLLRGRHRLPEEVHLAGGSFLMGSSPEEAQKALAFCEWKWPDEQTGVCRRDLYEREQPARAVQLSPFSMDTTEVTCGRYAAWLNSQRGLAVQEDERRWVLQEGVRILALTPHPGRDLCLQWSDGRFTVKPGSSEVPVTQVTWEGARRYCLSRGRRLPTEAEWEFAARGRERRRFPWGAAEPTCAGVVFGRVNNSGCPGLPAGPEPVAGAPQDRTPEGILNLGGNVAEWVEDRFEARYPACAPPCRDPVVGAAPAPREPAPGPDLRVFRGGSYSHLAVTSRGSGRGRWAADGATADVGFRCVRRR